MGIVSAKQCDVTGVITSDVEPYKIDVTHPVGVVEGDEAEPPTYLSRVVYLSPRALKRLTKFIERGCTPPPPRNAGTKTEAPSDRAGA